MKITRREVLELERFMERVEYLREEKYVLGAYDSTAAKGSACSEPWPEPFYAERPHLLMAMGFDEFVALANRKQLGRLWRRSGIDDSPQSIYRAPGGQWHLLFLAPTRRNSTFSFKSKETINHGEDAYSLEIGFEDLLDRLYAIADKWIPEERSLVSHVLWTPSLQVETRATLQGRVSAILSALIEERISLDVLSWQQLEEVVAEVLRMHGLEIYVVKDRPQGGRDIVARGELIPGQEPVEMAVEVKHRKLVTRPAVQKALWQNRHYPALLFVTSGRFSGGVFKERNLPENRLRLFLKDGDAIGDLIRDYGGLLV